MNSTELYDLLNRIGACSEAVEWAQGKDLQTFWDTCPRADWMLRLVGRMAGKAGWPTRKEIVIVSCDCAEEALPFVAAGENRPKEAIETARKWARGEATIDAVIIAAAYAAANSAVYSASASAAAAAYAAANSAVYSASASAAAAAAAYAGVPQERLVEIVRKRIPVPYTEEAK